MSSKDVFRLAIVEDNATARGNLRTHLLPVGNLEIHSFSSGNELKTALKKRYYDIILVDYHLGTGKNGVEWVHNLKESNYIKPSMGVIFITAERLPRAIGEIIDLHPDGLILKPYTLTNLHRHFKSYLLFRHTIKSALFELDDNNYDQALSILSKVKNTLPKRNMSDYNKLKARILIESGNIGEALSIYEQALQHSNQILWAQWGKIKCQYLNGDWEECKEFLKMMSSSTLNRDRAFEWLASLSYEQSSFQAAEHYLDRIKTSDLTTSAAKLKSITYKEQNRVLEGVELLEKKRAYNRSSKEKFEEFTFELAEFYLAIAEKSPQFQRKESLAQARKLIGIASRSHGDQQQMQKQDVLLAYSAALEGNLEKSTQLLSAEHMNIFNRTSPRVLILGAKTYKLTGDDNKAKKLIEIAESKLNKDNQIGLLQEERKALIETEKDASWTLEKAESLNLLGTQSFAENGKSVTATNYFYKAHILVPQNTSFAINLFQSLIATEKPSFKELNLYLLKQLIDKQKLEQKLANRFEELLDKISSSPKLNAIIEQQEANYLLQQQSISSLAFDSTNSDSL